MSDKHIVLITGANAGLGYEIVRALCASDRVHRILLGSRSIEKGQKAAETAQAEFPDTKSSIDVVPIDIEDDDSIQGLYKLLESRYGRVDTLVNNAGAQFDMLYKSGEMTVREAWNKSWSLNVTSTHVMTDTFVPLLLKSQDPRLMFMASGLSSFGLAEDDNMPYNKVPAKGWPKPAGNPQSGSPAYRSSKSGMNMMMREWYRTLKDDGVKVWCISPGMLATNLSGDPAMLRKLGALDPSVGGNFVKDVVEGKRDEDVGKVILKDRVQPW